VRIVRLAERRRARQHRADVLDGALDAALTQVDQAEDFGRELEAARWLAAAHLPTRAPAEGLVALRAALAARRATHAHQTRSRFIVQGVPGAVAAAGVGLAVFFGLHATGAQNNLAGAQSAVRALQEITTRMAAVNQVASSNNLRGVVQAADSARQSLVEAQQVAGPLPASDPFRNLLLQTAEAKIAELEALLAQLKLPLVASLPPVPSSSSASSQQADSSGTSSSPAQAHASTSTSSSTSSTTTTTQASSPSTSTTTTTQGGSALAAGPGQSTSTTGTANKTQAQPNGQGSTTTTSTTTSTTTTSTTPVPPPPSTTTTTAPTPPPSG